MTNTVSVKEKYSLEGQYIDPLIGGAIKSDGTLTFIYNPNLTDEALEQVYNSLYDYQVSEAAMATFESAAIPVINISNFYGWIKSLGNNEAAFAKEIPGKFIKALQALLTPGSWKLPSADSNLPFENHSYPAKGDGTDGFDSLEGYLGSSTSDSDIISKFEAYKEKFNDLKTYLEGETTWADLEFKVNYFCGSILPNLIRDLEGDYPEQAKELANYAMSFDILRNIMYFWDKNGGATLATTKNFFASDAYQRCENQYLFAAADARQKIVMIGGEEQLTAALLQDLIVKYGKMLEEYTLDLNAVQVYLEWQDDTNKKIADALMGKYGVKNVDDLKKKLEGLLSGKTQTSYNQALRHYERLTAPVEYDRLLSLVLMYNPFDGTGQRITALTKNANGTYTAALAEEYTSEISLKSCEERMNLPYFALAMCYEKTTVLRTVIFVHVKEIEDLNAKITENNKWLRYANEAYQNYYSWAIYSNNIYADDSSKLWKVISTKAGTTISGETKVSAEAFLNYLKNECGMGEIDAGKIVPWGDYNDAGEFKGNGKGNRFNIDVEEQGFLTLISNWQEAIRQHGDLLSTESQKKTLELTQDFQIYNSACGINSQICKVAGGTYDAVASNIR